MNEQTIRGWFASCPDVQMYSYTSDLTNVHCLLLYCEGLCDSSRINESLLPELHHLIPETNKSSKKDDLLGQIMLTRIEQPWQEEQISKEIFGGNVLIYYPTQDVILRYKIQIKPSRNPEDSNMENSTLGPRDGFIEEINTNIALIRKRLHTNQLNFEEFEVGNQNQTKVALLYMKGISDRPYLLEARRRLSTLNMDSVTGIAQLIGYISDYPYSLFPLITYTGRPDFAVDCLLHDRFVIIVDGNPAVLIAPANLFLLLKSPEDIFVTFGVASIGRLSRLIGLFFTICLPGFWVAITRFNQDQLPFPLLATVTLSRIGLPLSATLEMGLALFFLELFREAGSRLPQSIGQPITVVGGLIIGDAAIRAGLISPSMVVVSALTAVTASTLVNLNLSGNTIVLRMSVFAISAFLGLFGFMISIVFMMWYLSHLRSFGIPYLAPISPLYWRDVWSSLTKPPTRTTNSSPSMLSKSKRKT
jgi:spore germination protein KA